MLTNYCIGLAVNCTGLCAVKTTGRDRRLTIVSAESVVFDSPTVPPGTDTVRAGLGSLDLDSRPGLHLQMALPDPATAIGVFKFKRMPSGQRARLDLLRLRFEDEYGIPASEIKVSYQPIRDGSEGVSLFAVAARCSWLDPIEQACAGMGLVASVIDAASCFRFNLLRPVMDSVHSGALLSVESDSWSLMVWRAGPVLCGVHSRWRSASGTDLESIVVEALRRLRSFLSEHQQEAFSYLYISADEEEMTALQAAGDARLSLPTRPFPILWSSSNIALGTYSSTALAAALPR